MTKLCYSEAVFLSFRKKKPISPKLITHNNIPKIPSIHSTIVGNLLYTMFLRTSILKTNVRKIICSLERLFLLYSNTTDLASFFLRRFLRSLCSYFYYLYYDRVNVYMLKLWMRWR